MSNVGVLSGSSHAALPAASSNKDPAMCNYQVVQTLGEGAFGEVLLIVDKKNPSCAVAMKKMSCADGDQNKINQIKKEAYIQRRLSKPGHDNIIRMIGMKNDQSFYYLFLEYADGGELFDKIEPDVGMPAARAQFYFRQIICGLKYIHSIGIVHRDIKPENLLLTSSHVLKISDFGMATVFRHEGKERELDMSCGTLPYAAPEVINATKYKAEPVDVWSAGIVLITMFTGELPWEKASDASESYLNWLSNTTLDENPWKKIDVRGLSFLRKIVTNRVDLRLTIPKIEEHPWYVHNYGEPVCNARPMKRRRLDEPENISPSTQIQSVSTAKRRHLDLEHKHIAGKKNTSFSQPTNMDDMLLTQYIDMSQGSSNPHQRMVRRMTRFCVNVNFKQAIERVCRESEFAGYSIRQKSPEQVLVTYREISMMINAYTMGENHGTIRVMLDFRRSRGDGIQFKRMFVELRDRMHDMTCHDGNNWLVDSGLTPEEPPEFVSHPSNMKMEE